MNTISQYWEYRAYNHNLQIVKGQEKATSFQHLAITLRQKGLQVIEAQVLDANGCLAKDRLNKMKLRVIPESEPEPKILRIHLIHHLISAVINLFRRN